VKMTDEYILRIITKEGDKFNSNPTSKAHSQGRMREANSGSRFLVMGDLAIAIDSIYAMKIIPVAELKEEELTNAGQTSCKCVVCGQEVRAYGVSTQREIEVAGWKYVMEETPLQFNGICPECSQIPSNMRRFLSPDAQKDLNELLDKYYPEANEGDPNA